MEILCCCGHLRSKRKQQHQDEPRLPTLAPPARLPPPMQHSLSALSPGSTVARSSLTNPLPGAAADASVQLAELIVEDSDDDHDDVPAQDSKNKSTSTLQAVKSRIRRHLSQDSLSRQSESEEQIAHRAEVKRLLRKRIQEELRTEADIPPSTPPRLVSGQVNIAVNGPRDTIEFTVDENKRDKEMAKLKAHHLAKLKEDHRGRLSDPFTKKLSAVSVGKENRCLESRAASLPDWVDTESKACSTDCQLGLRERTSLPDIPKSPALLPIRGPPFHDASSLVSWRMSLSADRLDDLSNPDKDPSLSQPMIVNSPANCSMADVRKPQPFNRKRSKSSPLTTRDHDTSNAFHSRQASLNSTTRDRIPASETLVRDESPVGLWLRTQSMQYRQSTTSGSPSEHELDDYHTHHVSYHQTEAQGSPSVTPTGTIRTCRQSYTERASAYLVPGPAHRINVIRAAAPPEAPPGLSSAQSSVTMSAADSPARRSSSVKPPLNPPRKGLGGLRLPSLRWNYSSGKKQTSLELKHSASSRPGSSTPSLPLSNVRRTAMETGSETSSFVRREAEPQTVEKRFRHSHLRMEPLVPIESKFKEIFDHDGDSSATNRNSFLSRLHVNIQKRDKLAAIESLDGNGTVGADRITFVQEPSRKPGLRLHGTSGLEAPDRGHLKVPIEDHGHSRAKSSGTSLGSSRKSGEPGRPRGFSSSKEGDETAQMWKRALRAENRSRSPEGSTSSDVPIAPADPGAAGGFNKFLTAPQPSSKESPKLPPPGVHSPTCDKRPSRGDDATFGEPLIKSDTILQGWAHQLESQDGKARERTRNHGSTSSPPFQATKVPPASWARFPSHNREQRNAAAGKADKIKSKDFAVKTTSATGEFIWTTDKPQGGSATPKVTGRSFSDKFALTFKTRWSKLIPRRSGTPSRDRSMQGGRRSSIQTGGDLEYPELELLPSAGRYRELRALEQEIDELKGVKAKRRSSSDTFAIQHDRPILIDKMADALQEHGAASDAELSKTSDTASFVEEKAFMVRLRSPDTPATEIQYPDAAHTKDVSVGSTVERYATPFSHLTPSEHGPSRAATPDPEAEFRVPANTHSPSFVKSEASAVRRASLHSTTDLNSSIDQLRTWHKQDKPKRRSAPMPIAPSFV